MSIKSSRLTVLIDCSNFSKFIRFLTSYGTVATQDLANDLEDYDTETKTQPSRRATTQTVDDVVDRAVGAFQ